MRTPWLYKANEIKHWEVSSKAERDGREFWIPARSYSLNCLNIIQRFMNAQGVFTGKYDALDWQESLYKEKGK